MTPDPTPIVDYASPLVRPFFEVPVSTVSPDVLLVIALIDTLLLVAVLISIFLKRV